MVKKQREIQKLQNINSNEKVLVIGNRLANLNAYRRNEHESLHQSNEALESLIQSNHLPNNSNTKLPYSNNSLHVDSAVSISAASQHSSPMVQIPPSPPPAPTPAPAPPPLPSRDDAQMVDFVSSFLFPISFIIFNIIYWMVYLNMQVLSEN
jgi:hypothetical protein